MVAGATTLRGNLRGKTASELREIGDKSLILSPILVFEHELNELGTMEGIIHNSELHVLVFQHHSANRCLECSLYDLCTEENEYESMRYDLCEKLEPGEVGHFEHVYIPKSYTDEDK